jgi:hypothetical protein
MFGWEFELYMLIAIPFGAAVLVECFFLCSCLWWIRGKVVHSEGKSFRPRLAARKYMLPCFPCIRGAPYELGCDRDVRRVILLGLVYLS